jgi:hypothetical protein
MRGFLSHLVHRALQPHPDLRPRLATRFEPLVAAASPLSAEAGDDDLAFGDVDLASREVARTVGREVAAPRTDGGTRVQPHIASGSDHGRGGALPIPNAMSPVPPTANTIEPGVTRMARTEERGGEGDRSVANDSAAHRGGRAPDRALDVAVEPAHRRSVTMRHVAAQQRADGDTIAPGPVLLAARAAESRTGAVSGHEQIDRLREPREGGTPLLGSAQPSTSSHERSRPMHGAPSAAISPVLQPIVPEARLALPTAERATRPSSSESPAIQVTIGRVEVRATVAPAPARTLAPSKQPLSLDDYLRQRGGAAR